VGDGRSSIVGVLDAGLLRNEPRLNALRHRVGSSVWTIGGSIFLGRRNRVELYGLCGLTWLVPFWTIEIHVSITFLLFMFHEIIRAYPRPVKAESEPYVPRTARTLGMVQMICEMEITDNV